MSRGKDAGGLVVRVDGEDEHRVGPGRQIVGLVATQVEPHHEDVDAVVDGVRGVRGAPGDDLANGAEAQLVPREEDAVHLGGDHEGGPEGADAKERYGEDEEGAVAAADHGGRLRRLRTVGPPEFGDFSVPAQAAPSSVIVSVSISVLRGAPPARGPSLRESRPAGPARAPVRPS